MRTMPAGQITQQYSHSHACSANLVTSFFFGIPHHLPSGASTYSMAPARSPVKATTQKAMK
jgi:hypothetical protein